MEADLRISGNILFSDGSSLRTTDGITTTTIVGNPLNLGYIEGVGTHAIDSEGLQASYKYLQKM